MNISYRFVADANYYKVVIQRYYRTRPLLRRPFVQYSLMLVVPTAVWLYALVENTDWCRIAGFLLLAINVMAVLAARVNSWGIFQRFKARSDFGTEITVTLSEEGISASGDHVESRWEWAAYPSSTRMPDGILLTRAGVIRWLPDSGIQSGTSEQAISLVGAKSELRHFT